LHGELFQLRARLRELRLSSLAKTLLAGQRVLEFGGVVAASWGCLVLERGDECCGSGWSRGGGAAIRRSGTTASVGEEGGQG
jgi:hypothetical protein